MTHRSQSSKKDSKRCSDSVRRWRLKRDFKIERARSGRKISTSYRFLADKFIPAQYYASYSDTIAAVDRAALEVAMQINAGSIERDCPEFRRKRAKDRYGGSKERGKDRGRMMYVRKRGTEREKPQGKRISASTGESE